MRYAGDYKGGPRNVINCRCTILYIDKTPDEETQIVDPQPDSIRRESPEPWVFREGIKPFFQIGAMTLRNTFGLGARNASEVLNPSSLTTLMSQYGGKWFLAQKGAKDLSITEQEAAIPFVYSTGLYNQINAVFRAWFDGDTTVRTADGRVDMTDAVKAEALGYRAEMKKVFEKLPAYRGEVHRGVSDSVEKRMEQFGNSRGWVNLSGRIIHFNLL